MKPGMSSLNPYAASYVPLSKREMTYQNKLSKITDGVAKSGDGDAWSKPPENHNVTQKNELRGGSSLDYNFHSIGELLDPMDLTQKSHHSIDSHEPWSQSPSNITDKHNMIEETDMHLAFLTMTFPGISYQSLSDVYSANGGDLEASLDMLNELEFGPTDFSQHLPDTLDIGDVPDFGSPKEAASLRLKKTTSDEASGSGSSSCPSGSAS